MSKLIPEAQVALRYGRHITTLSRWDRDPDLGFPKVIIIRNRRYRDEEQLDAFDKAQAEKTTTIVDRLKPYRDGRAA